MGISNKIFTINFDKRYFPLPLCTKWIDGRLWELVTPFQYVRDNGETIEVPVGFMTDYASIPLIFYSWIGPPTGEFAPASIIHDFLCFKAKGNYAKADYVFKECMTVLEVPCWKRTIMWLAVRAFHHFQ